MKTLSKLIGAGFIIAVMTGLLVGFMYLMVCLAAWQYPLEEGALRDAVIFGMRLFGGVFGVTLLIRVLADKEFWED